VKIQPKNILLVKLCCLGDIIFLTPTMRALRSGYPTAKISLLASSWVEELIPCIPFVDEYVRFDAPFTKSRLKQIAETLSLLAKVRKSDLDLVVLGHRNKLLGVLVKMMKPRMSVGFRDAGFLTESVPFDDSAHEVDRYLSFLRILGLPTKGIETELRPLESDVQFVSELHRRNGISTGELIVGVFPGGGENPGSSMTIKRWPPGQYVRLINDLAKQYACTVVLVGSKSEHMLNVSIRESVRQKVRVFNYAGETNLRQFVALAKSFAVFVGGDSGPTHIAAAAGTPTVSIFGPSDPRLVGPRGPLHRSVWNHVECSPCYTPSTVRQKKYFRGNEFFCHTGTHACIKTLELEEVQHALADVMKTSNIVKTSISDDSRTS
jgi:ADP-heptose:LPS heptosyltransferase